MRRERPVTSAPQVEQTDGDLRALLEVVGALAAALRRAPATVTYDLSGPHVLALGQVMYQAIVGAPFDLGVSVCQLDGLRRNTERYQRFLDRRLALMPKATPTRIVDLVGRMLDADPRLRPRLGEVATCCAELAETTEGRTLGLATTGDDGWEPTLDPPLRRGVVEQQVRTASAAAVGLASGAVVATALAVVLLAAAIVLLWLSG